MEYLIESKKLLTEMTKTMIQILIAFLFKFIIRRTSKVGFFFKDNITRKK